jgi:hypothetical protein
MSKQYGEFLEKYEDARQAKQRLAEIYVFIGMS